MKKKLLLLVLLIISTISCSKDDEITAVQSLEGKWNYHKRGVISDGEEILKNYEHKLGCNKDYIQISESTIINHQFYSSEECLDITDTASYTRDGNTLLITEDGVTVTATILKMDKTTLKIKTHLQNYYGQPLYRITIYTKN